MSREALFQSRISYCTPGAWDLHIKLVDQVRGLKPRNIRKSPKTLVNGCRCTLPQRPGLPRPHNFSAPDLTR